MEKVITKLGFAVFKDKKILMARYKESQVYYFVGGQLRDGETEVECLKRKVPDEIGAEVQEGNLTFLGEFSDAADGREDTLVTIRLYTGNLTGAIVPNHDVEELQYFDSSVSPDKVSAIATNKILPWLRLNRYIL